MTKKIIILFFTLFVSVSAATAQDIITLKSAEEIKAKVQEIGTDNVKYKKYDNLNGPTYTLVKSDIFMIKYENGEKEVFTAQNQPVQEKQASTPTGSSVQQNDYSQINAMTKRGKVPLREKNYEIGIQLDAGTGWFYVSDSKGNYKDENNGGFIGGGGIFVDIYPQKTDFWLLGAGLSYWWHYYMTDYDYDLSLSYVNWDLYFGGRDPLKISGVKLYAKVGLRLGFLTGATISDANSNSVNAKSDFNSTVFGMMTEWGYPTKHFDFGVKAFWMPTNIYKSGALSGSDLSSGIWGITLTCAYRFSF
ncbi:MAG: hypothetical protein LBK94_01470 [Prevotellaceae bacterium]|nr:hypothetical protein [Prevotellaceae bacterium]